MNKPKLTIDVQDRILGAIRLAFRSSRHRHARPPSPKCVALSAPTGAERKDVTALSSQC